MLFAGVYVCTFQPGNVQAGAVKGLSLEPGNWKISRTVSQAKRDVHDSCKLRSLVLYTGAVGSRSV